MKVGYSLVFAFLCIAVFGGVFASSGTCDGFTWEYDENSQELTISGSGTLNSYNDCVSFNKEVKSVVINEGVTKLYDSFEDWTNLTSVTIPSSLTTVGYNAFRNTSLKTFHIPKTLTSLDFGAFWGCQQLESFTIDDNHPKYVIDGGVVFNLANTVLLRYPPAKPGKQYEIPDSVVTVGECAFQSCNKLKSIIIPDSVTTLQEYSFHRLKNVKSLVIPGSVKRIDNYVFCFDDNLSYVKYLGDAPPTSGRSPFSDCPALNSICVEPTYTSTTFCLVSVTSDCVEPSSSSLESSEEESSSGESKCKSSESSSKPSHHSLVSLSIMHTPSIVLLALALFMLL